MRAFRILLLTGLALAFATAFSTSARATAVPSDLRQIGLATHGEILFDAPGDVSVTCGDGSVRTVSGVGPVVCADGSVRPISGDGTFACSDGSVRSISSDPTIYCGDGSVRSVSGDGSVRFVSVDVGSRAAFCFDNVHVPGGITDGTSNTILFGESAGLRVTPGYIAGRESAHSILDGSSHTILFGEVPDTGFCLGDTTIGDPFVGTIVDGTSNTILLGGDSRLDLCFEHARIGSITDGTSNTLLFGEAQSGVCLGSVRAGDGLAVIGAVPEPISLALLFPAVFGVGVLRRRFRRR